MRNCEKLFAIKKTAIAANEGNGKMETEIMPPQNSFGSPIEGKDANRANKPVSIKERQGLRAQQLAELGPHMDLIKIARIKKQLAEGEYSISPDLIALHLLDDSAGQ